MNRIYKRYTSPPKNRTNPLLQALDHISAREHVMPAEVLLKWAEVKGTVVITYVFLSLCLPLPA